MDGAEGVVRRETGRGRRTGPTASASSRGAVFGGTNCLRGGGALAAPVRPPFASGSLCVWGGGAPGAGAGRRRNGVDTPGQAPSAEGGGGAGAARRTRATRRRQRGRLTPRFLLVASAGRGEFVGVARLISLSILLVAAGAAAAARRRGREDGRARAPPPGGGRRVADERRGGRVCFPPAPLSVLIFPRPPSPSCLDGRGGGCAATRTRAHPRGGLYRASPSPCHFAPG